MKKTAIITGGNKGIGLAITEAFVNEGYFVIVGARQKMNLNKFKKNVFFINCDVTNEFSHIKLVKKALQLTGRLDVYINNAGVSEWKPLHKISKKFIEKIINTNLVGTIWGCKAASVFLKKGGSIINISSIAGKRGTSNNSIYCASKFGVNGITQSLSKELGSRNITVNSVCPSYVDTPMTERTINNIVSNTNLNKEDAIKEIISSNPQNKLINPTEIANTVLWLCNEASSSINGHNISISGGEI